jgi:SAM-dependent methyltransferase
MHYTAMKHAKLFFETYCATQSGARILDLGAQDVNGSLRDVAPIGSSYVGADFAAAKGVDVVLEDAYNLPFADESFDICVSSSCFEHAEFFWLAFTEVLRVLKPDGLFYLNAPSNGNFHRYPVDCWRFYPDAAVALAKWGRRSGYNPMVLESFWGKQEYAGWNDYVAIFVKNRNLAGQYPSRMIDHFEDFTNGIRDEGTEILKEVHRPEDKRRLFKLPKALRLLIYKRDMSEFIRP